MADAELLDPVFDFVDRNINSLEHLEILLLLAATERRWTAADIFQRIQSSQSSVEQRLRSLVAAGFLAQDENNLFYFAPKNADTRSLVARLADAYRTRHVPVIEAIYTRKSDSVRRFANAFKLKPD